MSDAKKDGGPAFPHQKDDGSPYWGMTLRDWFAAHALMSMLSAPDKISESTFDRAAGLSYRFADAMLEARK